MLTTNDDKEVKDAKTRQEKFNLSMEFFRQLKRFLWFIVAPENIGQDSDGSMRLAAYTSQ